MSPVSSVLGLVTAFKPIPKQHANVHTLTLVRSFVDTHIWIFTFQIKNILCNMQDVFGHHNTIVQYEFALDTYIYILSLNHLYFMIQVQGVGRETPV